MLVEIFCCYARKDQQLLNELKAHLLPLERQGLITIWADTDIGAGTEWEKEIEKHLDTADIILILVSPAFIASDYCYSKELKRAMERHEQGNVRVIPIVLRPTIWRKTPFGKLQALPKDAIPVTSWHVLDEAFISIAEGIRKVAEDLIIKKLRDTSKSIYQSQEPTTFYLNPPASIRPLAKSLLISVVFLIVAAFVLLYAGTLNSWVLGGLLGGLGALLVAIPISFTIFNYLALRHDRKLLLEEARELAEAQEEFTEDHNGL